MSDTQPAETGSGLHPLDEPDRDPDALSNPDPSEPASAGAPPGSALPPSIAPEIDEERDYLEAGRSGNGHANDPILGTDAVPLGPYSTLPRYPGEGEPDAPRYERVPARSMWDEPEVEFGPDAGEPGRTGVSGGSSIWPWGMHGLIETVEVLALALLMFLVVRSVAQNFVVDGGSMEPTFHNGEMLIVNKLAYRTFNLSWLPFTDKDDWRPFGVPQPGDVVVFKFPQDQNRDFIKRVVAVPGQTVEVRGGKVYLDGVQQNEPYLDQAPTYDYGPTKVEDGQLFVLGDNRNNSYDSHSWGLLDQSLLIGRAELRYWPLGRVGRIDHGGLSAESGVTITQGAQRSSSISR